MTHNVREAARLSMWLLIGLVGFVMGALVFALILFLGALLLAFFL